MTAACLARRFPSIVDRLERGEIHLSSLVLLRDFLTSENHEEVLGEAAHKTKAQVKELLARRFPRPDVANSLTRIGAIATTEFLPSMPASPAVAPPGRATLPRAIVSRPLQARTDGDAEMREKLERAVELMCPRNPSGDYAVVVDKARDAFARAAVPLKVSKQVASAIARASGHRRHRWLVHGAARAHPGGSSLPRGLA